jgi:hypothetical protein
MSITEEQLVQCACGTAVRVVLAESLNAGRHPHLRQALLDGELHRFTCGTCGARVLVEKQLLYFDAERHHFFVVLPRDELAHEAQGIAIVRRLYDVSFGPPAAETLQELGRAMMVRLVYGLPALREKVLADEAGLNDLALEALKCEVLGQLPELEHRATAALWLGRVLEGELELWAETDGAPLPVRVPRWTYDSIVALGAEQILRFRPGLAKGPHVSMQRLGLAFEGPAAE